ncbi:MAG: ATP-binding protein, partial [Melioribacteraceae bacterium]|nr:ATP-binding protein [Melioribacteraceae bacterium]
MDINTFEKEPSPYFLLVDKDNIIWIANWGRGLDKYNPKTKIIRNYSFDPKNPSSISNDFITKICADSSNGIWIATNDGNLNKLNTITGEIKRFNIAKYTGYIDRVYTDSKNRVWAGTFKGGIILFDPNTDKFRRITKSEGMPSNSYINGFSEDELGNIYCCSPNYLIKFNEKAEIESYYKFGKNDEFLHNTTFIKKTRELFVLSDKGFYRFHIDSLRKNSTPPKMVLTSLKIHNKPINPGKKTAIDKHINLAKEIILNYDMNDITIEYSGLHFVNPKEQNYKYMLENYDDEWREVGKLRRADYANLEYGEYIFKVLGSNSDGFWAAEPATISIVILPPWWLTWWAYLIYSVIIISTLIYAYVLQKKRLRVKHEIEMKNFEAAKLKEVDQMKSKFFANISHEFRTPLTLIKTPVERLLEKERSNDTNKAIYKMILRNSDRLLSLINELFDLSKLESGIMKLSAQKSDIVSFVKGIAMSFESLAQKKKIQLSISSSHEIIELFFDKEKIQKIIGNLLSNAIKFTQEKGRVVINISRKSVEKRVEITISDNGVGIPKEELPKIFDRFYQVERHKNEGNIGAGIGLSLSKELIEMHHGDIKVTSELKRGTTFVLSFPMGEKHLKEDEIIFDELIDKKEEGERICSENEGPIVGKSKPLILIIEDNIDVQNLIKETIEKKYITILANDGKEGYEKAIKDTPDLVISDIMMPKETGDKMCEKLKKNNITSHIPIVLLTAKGSGVDKISGLEVGADDYLVKPFNDKELLARIKNLITQRQKLREKYLREAEIHPTEVAVTSTDKKFIESVIKIV